jgi:hypothetical protein
MSQATSAARVLFVLTSHDKKGDQPSGFFLSEVTHPYKVLTEAGYHTTPRGVPSSSTPSAPPRSTRVSTPPFSTQAVTRSCGISPTIPSSLP